VRSFHEEFGEQHFVWRRGQLTALEPPQGMGADPSRINDQGIVVGTASSSGRSVPVLWHDETVMVLAPPEEATDAFGRDINDQGTVLVDAFVSGATVSYRWEEGLYSALPVLPGRSGNNAFSINNADVVVGSAHGPFGTQPTAAVWYGQRVADLNELVRANDPLKPHVQLQFALVVNDRGEIVARGMDRRDSEAGTPAVNHYLLTPVD
jgi:uncharacterized membrane protein